jgi:hypothetical protein
VNTPSAAAGFSPRRQRTDPRWGQSQALMTA